MVIAACLICFLPPKSANAITFVFNGTCTVDCAGTASAILVLQNYTVGNAFGSANFVSLAYHSNFLGDILVTPTSPTTPFLFASGQFNSLPAPASVVVSFMALLPTPTQMEFSSFDNGLWCIGQGCVADAGVNGVWVSVAPPNAVPLPAALPLFVTGLGALGLIGWRRKRKAQPRVQ
jgi:hypothetical protein